MNIRPLPAFNDNYLWLIEGEEETWVVDPGDGEVVAAALEKSQRTLTGILITHHHSDHVGGIEHLMHKDLIVAGPATSKHPKVNRPLSEGESIILCNRLFSVMEVPGHTHNHIAYYSRPESLDAENHDTESHDMSGNPPQSANSLYRTPILFSGDTLFAGGCGRIFDGTLEQLHDSLARIALLPSDTAVYCAHEYTLNNLGFALTLEPSNQALQSRIVACQAQRHKGQPTVPSRLSDELETNPFLRTHSREIQASARRKHPQMQSDAKSIFSAIRSLKDNF